MNDRIIKFRAWHEKLERMIFAGFSIGVGGGTLWKDESGKSWGDLELLQYTGLKDKNGKEIYEGDIVRLDHWSPKEYIVEFNRGAFCFKHNKDDASYNDCKYLEKCEVIGNIHENPELLKSV